MPPSSCRQPTQPERFHWSITATIDSVKHLNYCQRLAGLKGYITTYIDMDNTKLSSGHKHSVQWKNDRRGGLWTARVDATGDIRGSIMTSDLYACSTYNQIITKTNGFTEEKQDTFLLSQPDRCTCSDRAGMTAAASNSLVHQNGNLVPYS